MTSFTDEGLETLNLMCVIWVNQMETGQKERLLILKKKKPVSS